MPSDAWAALMRKTSLLRDRSDGERSGSADMMRDRPNPGGPGTPKGSDSTRVSKAGARIDLIFTMSNNGAGRLKAASGANVNPGRAAIPAGGARRDRTDDLLLAKQALSQLSYGPFEGDRAQATENNGFPSTVAG